MKKLKISFVTLAFLVLCGTSCKNAENEKPLNVVILLVDDMGYGDIAANGNPIIKTPNFDVLHDQSVRFSNFAVSPTCSPSRAAIMTGKHEFMSRVTHTILPMRNMDLKSVTIAELFNKKGYKTGLFGKWHLGQSGRYGPWYRGFDETLTVPGDDQHSHFDPVLLKNQVETKFKGYREDILFNEAMRFIAENKDSAFFCYLATYSPHAPNIVPEKYTAPYEIYRNNKNFGNFRPEFYGQIANVDENLGRLLTCLDSLGLEDNTLIIALNDNGGTFGVDVYNAGMRGTKTSAWTGGTRAFSFWKWGNHFSPGERKLMCGNIDILPTLADLCDLAIPESLREQLDGESLRPVLENAGATFDENRMLVHHVGRWYNQENWEDHKYSACSVSWGNYTLVRTEPCSDPECITCVNARRNGLLKINHGYSSNSENYALTLPGKWELYDIDSDPFQANNIADEHPDIVKKMSDYYEKWWVKVAAVMKERK